MKMTCVCCVFVSLPETNIRNKLSFECSGECSPECHLKGDAYLVALIIIFQSLFLISLLTRNERILPTIPIGIIKPR